MIKIGEVEVFSNKIDGFLINQSKALLALNILSDLMNAYLNNQNPNITSVYSAFVVRLSGSELETPIKNYITMLTGLTNFDPSITDANKRQILNAAIGFLICGLIVWINKNAS